MTSFLVLIIILLIILLFGFSYIAFVLERLLHLKSKSSNKTLSSIDNITILDWKSKGLLFLALIFIILSFFAPFLLTRTELSTSPDFDKTGRIADTIGGLMSPFIALAGVVVTGLAFYIQFKANLLQRALFNHQQIDNKKQFKDQIDHQNNQIKLQQFESQFYEMLNLHRSNINEMKIEGYDFKEEKYTLEKFEKLTEGRKVFVTMKTELECILARFADGEKLTDEKFNKGINYFFPA